MEIIAFIIATFKELLMKYSLWQVVLAVGIPILIFVLPELINAIANLINVLGG